MSQNHVVSSSSQSQSQPRKGVALVTGASRGIGLGIALRLADDGYDIAANGETSTSELAEAIKKIEEKGRRALAIPGDVSEESVVRDMIKRTVSTLGRLDVMVANAGIAMFGSLLETSIEAFDRQMAVNVRGTMLCYKLAAEEMVERKRGGRIIGACSLAGKQAIDNLFGYSATKFAIRGLTQSAARELGKHHITVNAYAAGGVKTRLLDAYTKEYGASAGSEGLLNAVAIRRVGKPEDIASLVSYLVSDEAGYITGQTITIDGGIYFD